MAKNQGYLMSKNQLVLVLGMHRSGTSLVTSMVESNGFFCGKHPMQPSRDNPNGYWEDDHVVDINNRLLASLGYYWFSLVWLDLPTLQQSTEYKSLREMAVNYINELLEESNKLVLKDPRFCILLPFWFDVLSSLDLDVKVVLVKRDFISTASSLVKRDHFDFEYAAQLIYLHWSAVVAFLPESIERILVTYEDISHNELGVRHILKDFCGVKTPINDTLFQKELEHNVGVQKIECGFCWQQDMLRNFPDSRPDKEKIASLHAYYHALNVAYFQPLHRTYIINEIKNIADSLKGKRVILYGASELTSILIGQLSETIVLSVDYAASDTVSIDKYGTRFCSPQAISDVEHDIIFVGVLSREDEVRAIVSEYSNKPIIFAEALFLQHR